MTFRGVSRLQYDELREEKTFRQTQREKPRCEYVGYIDKDGDVVDKRVDLPMTDTWEDLQKEYDTWDRNRYRKGDIYFVF